MKFLSIPSVLIGFYLILNNKAFAVSLSKFYAAELEKKTGKIRDWSSKKYLWGYRAGIIFAGIILIVVAINLLFGTIYTNGAVPVEV
jgi:hypothetical protein